MVHPTPLLPSSSDICGDILFVDKSSIRKSRTKTKKKKIASEFHCFSLLFLVGNVFYLLNRLSNLFALNPYFDHAVTSPSWVNHSIKNTTMSRVHSKEPKIKLLSPSYFKPKKAIEISKANFVPLHDETPDLADLNLPESTLKRLFEHQKLGVQWLYGLHLSQPGGILGGNFWVLLFTFQCWLSILALIRWHGPGKNLSSYQSFGRVDENKLDKKSSHNLPSISSPKLVQRIVWAPDSICKGMRIFCVRRCNYT